MSGAKKLAAAAFVTAAKRYVVAATDKFDLFVPLLVAFAIADKTGSHRFLLDEVHRLLCWRHGHERTERRFRERGMPRRGLQEREFFLICQYYTSKKTQDEFAE